MSFLIRQISRTADGREIVRPKVVETSQLIVGRDPSTDIHLPDLGVTLRHAVIQSLGGSRVEIAAAAGLPFDVNGKQTERTEIDAARGADVRLGAHVLSFSKGEGEDAGRVVISVERVGAVSDASEAKDEARAFSLAGVAPPKRATAWTLALLILAVFLVWPLYAFYSNHTAPGEAAMRPAAFHADEMWSSGHLSLVHSNLENDCKACHTQPGVAVRDTACVACHTAIHDHADPRRLAAARTMPGFGDRVQNAVASAFNKPEGACVDCHTEHEGRNAMPVTEQRFCSNCHGTLNERLTDTRILNASDFGTDHPEFRPAIMTDPGAARPTVRRLSLEARPLEDNGLKFPHEIHLVKTGSVARMAQSFGGLYGFGERGLACANCHVPDSSGARFQPITMEQNCGMCHSLAFDQIGGTIRTLRHGDVDQTIADIRAFYRSTGPVRPINFGGQSRRRPGEAMQAATFAEYNRAAAERPGRAEAAVRAVFSQGGACFDCHSVTQPGQNGNPTWGIVPVRQPMRYMQLGWFDHKAHETETCESCHAARTSTNAQDVLLPKIESCRECHGGEGAAKAVPSSCAMCHDYHMDAGAPQQVRDERTRGRLIDSTGRAAAASRSAAQRR